MQHAREQGGTGLGLAIALRAVEAHGGKISLSAPQGGGASVQIELPLTTEIQGSSLDKV